MRSVILLHIARTHVLYGKFAVQTGYFDSGVISQKRISPPLFSVFHGFQNVAVTADILQLAQSLYRGYEVRKELALYRYNVITG